MVLKRDKNNDYINASFVDVCIIFYEGLLMKIANFEAIKLFYLD